MASNAVASSTPSAAIMPILGIHGAPRSGTTWLGQLFNSHPAVAYRYQPFFSYAFRGRLDISSSPVEVQSFFEDLLNSQDDFVLQRGKSRLSASSPTFHKTDAELLVYKEVRFHHLLPTLFATNADFKLIAIIRNPIAVLASWRMAPREFDSSWSFRDEWRGAEKKNQALEENWYGYARWKQLADLFLSMEDMYAGRCKIVRYEDLVAEPLGTIRALFRFAGLEVTPQTSHFINASTSRDDGDPYGVYRHSRHSDRGLREVHEDIKYEIKSDLSNSKLARFLS